MVSSSAIRWATRSSSSASAPVATVASSVSFGIGERPLELLEVVGAGGLEREGRLGLEVLGVAGPGVLLELGVVQTLAQRLLGHGVRRVRGRLRQVRMVLGPADRAAGADREPARDLGGHPLEPCLLEHDELLDQPEATRDHRVEVELGGDEVVADGVQRAARVHPSYGVVAGRASGREAGGRGASLGRRRPCVVEVDESALVLRLLEPSGQVGALALAGQEDARGRGGVGGLRDQGRQGVGREHLGGQVDEVRRRGQLPLGAARRGVAAGSGGLGDPVQRDDGAGPGRFERRGCGAR